MKHLEKTKMILGYVLIAFSVLGVLIALSYQFDWDLFYYDYKTFGQNNDGGASNAPSFFGLIGVAGAILLASVKKENSNSNE